MRTVVFEDYAWRRFLPLALNRHLSLLFWGTKTLLDSAKELARAGEIDLVGRDYLAQTSEESLGVDYNPDVDEDVLLLNARLRPTRDVIRAMSKRKKFALISRDELALAVASKSLYTKIGSHSIFLDQKSTRKLTKEVERLRTDEASLLSYPWEMVESNGFAIAKQRKFMKEHAAPPRLSHLKGPAMNLIISPSAQIEEFTTFDTTSGPIIIEDGALVESFTHISGPAVIGPESRIHSALIRAGTTIGRNCRIGGEVESCIVYPYTNKTHDGYVGNSIIGEWVNVGAGATFSNLKNTYGTVKVFQDEKRVDTGLVKVGSFVGDMAKISIGCMLFAGKRIGLSSHLHGVINTDVPDFTFYGGERGKFLELTLESVLNTQRRMTERRGLSLSKNQEHLIRYLFRSGEGQRRAQKVRKGILAIGA